MRRAAPYIVSFAFGLSATTVIAWLISLTACVPSRVMQGAWLLYTGLDWNPSREDVFAHERSRWVGNARRQDHVEVRKRVIELPGRLISWRIHVEWERTVSEWQSNVRLSDPQPVVVEYVAGLPWHAMRGRVKNLQVQNAMWGSDAQLGFVSDRSLPLRIIWPGFLMDVAVFAASMLVAIKSWRMVKSLIGRIIKAPGPGQCKECTYNLAGNPGNGCPECGWRRRGTGS